MLTKTATKRLETLKKRQRTLTSQHEKAAARAAKLSADAPQRLIDAADVAAVTAELGDAEREAATLSTTLDVLAQQIVDEQRQHDEQMRADLLATADKHAAAYAQQCAEAAATIEKLANELLKHPTAIERALGQIPTAVRLTRDSNYQRGPRMQAQSIQSTCNRLARLLEQVKK